MNLKKLNEEIKKLNEYFNPDEFNEKSGQCVDCLDYLIQALKQNPEQFHDDIEKLTDAIEVVNRYTARKWADKIANY